jgi:hypothetical protein
LIGRPPLRGTDRALPEYALFSVSIPFLLSLVGGPCPLCISSAGIGHERSALGGRYCVNAEHIDGGLYNGRGKKLPPDLSAAFLKAADGMVFHGDREPLDRGVR